MVSDMQGGQGSITIYLGKDGKQYACKHMLDTSDSENVKRFQREIKIAEKINHPNVIKIIDSGVDKDGPYYCMPLYAGSLMDYLTLDLFTHPEVQYDIFMQILAGVEELHRNGIIHRDLKPGNILLNSPEDVVICDFGFSKDENASSSYTTTGEGFGTIGYVSPEQAWDSKHVDGRTDIYALGKILNDISGRVCKCKVHKAVKRVADKASAPDLNERYSSVSEMREAVKDAYKLWKDEDNATSIKEKLDAIISNKVSDLQFIDYCDDIVTNAADIQGIALRLGEALDEYGYRLFEEHSPENCLRMHELIWRDWHDTWDGDYLKIDYMASTTKWFFDISDSPEIKGFIVAELCDIAHKGRRYHAMDIAAEMIATMGTDTETRRAFKRHCSVYDVKSNYKQIGKEAPSWL